MKALTLGKYPVKGSWISESPSAQWTSAIELAVLVVAKMAAMKQFVLPYLMTKNEESTLA